MAGGTAQEPGVGYYITIFGDGKININTADPLVLQCLSQKMTEGYAEDMVTYRDSVTDMELAPTNWYHQNAGVPQDAIPNTIVTTKSKHFEIASVGDFRGIKKRILAVFERDPNSVKILTLSWKVE